MCFAPLTRASENICFWGARHVGSWSDLCSCREHAKLGAKLHSKNSGHPRAVERAEECPGASHPSGQTGRKAEVAALLQVPRCTPPGWQRGLVEL